MSLRTWVCPAIDLEGLHIHHLGMSRMRTHYVGCSCYAWKIHSLIAMMVPSCGWKTHSLTAMVNPSLAHALSPPFQHGKHRLGCSKPSVGGKNGMGNWCDCHDESGGDENDGLIDLQRMCPGWVRLMHKQEQ